MIIIIVVEYTTTYKYAKKEINHRIYTLQKVDIYNQKYST
jgi:hypothetical protein